MSQVISPVNFESQVIVGVDHLMSHSVLQMPLVLHLIGADQNPVLGIKAATLSVGATAAVDVVTVEVASKLPDVFTEEADDGTFAAGD
jgi:hypothetical protein